MAHSSNQKKAESKNKKFNHQIGKSSKYYVDNERMDQIIVEMLNEPIGQPPPPRDPMLCKALDEYEEREFSYSEVPEIDHKKLAEFTKIRHALGITKSKMKDVYIIPKLNFNKDKKKDDPVEDSTDQFVQCKTKSKKYKKGRYVDPSRFTVISRKTESSFPPDVLGYIPNPNAPIKFEPKPPDDPDLYFWVPVVKPSVEDIEKQSSDDIDDFTTDPDILALLKTVKPSVKNVEKQPPGDANDSKTNPYVWSPPITVKPSVKDVEQPFSDDIDDFKTDPDILTSPITVKPPVKDVGQQSPGDVGDSKTDLYFWSPVVKPSVKDVEQQSSNDIDDFKTDPDILASLKIVKPPVKDVGQQPPSYADDSKTDLYFWSPPIIVKPPVKDVERQPLDDTDDSKTDPDILPSPIIGKPTVKDVEQQPPDDADNSKADLDILPSQIEKLSVTDVEQQPSEDVDGFGDYQHSFSPIVPLFSNTQNASRRRRKKRNKKH